MLPQGVKGPDAALTGRLSVFTWLSLQHAAVHHVAESCGLRILALKGVVAVEDFPRTSLGGTDVDVLADPATVDVLLDGLQSAGWRELQEEETPTAGHHAIPLRHPTWGFSLDVHHRFPGTQLDPQELFDRLWERRREVPLGHVLCAVPSRGDHALLVILHALRSHDRGQAEIDLLWDELAEDTRAELLSRAQELAPAAGVAHAVGHRPPDVVLSLESRVWRHLNGKDAVVAGWMAGLLNAQGWRAKAAYLGYLAVAHPDPGEPWSRRRQVVRTITRLRRLPRWLFSLARIVRRSDVG